MNDMLEREGRSCADNCLTFKRYGAKATDYHKKFVEFVKPYVKAIPIYGVPLSLAAEFGTRITDPLVKRGFQALEHYGEKLNKKQRTSEQALVPRVNPLLSSGTNPTTGTQPTAAGVRQAQKDRFDRLRGLVQRE